MITYGITLKDGTTYSTTAKRLPRYWKSRAMDLAPYGTTFQGCTFFRHRSSDSIAATIRNDRDLTPFAEYLLDQTTPS